MTRLTHAPPPPSPPTAPPPSPNRHTHTHVAPDINAILTNKCMNVSTTISYIASYIIYSTNRIPLNLNCNVQCQYSTLTLQELHHHFCSINKCTAHAKSIISFRVFVHTINWGKFFCLLSHKNTTCLTRNYILQKHSGL